MLRHAFFVAAAASFLVGASAATGTASAQVPSVPPSVEAQQPRAVTPGTAGTPRVRVLAVTGTTQQEAARYFRAATVGDLLRLANGDRTQSAHGRQARGELANTRVRTDAAGVRTERAAMDKAGRVWVRSNSDGSTVVAARRTPRAKVGGGALLVSDGLRVLYEVYDRYIKTR